MGRGSYRSLQGRPLSAAIVEAAQRRYSEGATVGQVMHELSISRSSAKRIRRGTHAPKSAPQSHRCQRCGAKLTEVPCRTCQLQAPEASP